MNLDLNQCWDCPIPLRALLVLLTGGLLCVVGASRAIPHRGRIASAIGALLFALAALFYVGVSLGLARFGIDWRWSRHDLSFHFHTGSTPLVLAGWYILSFAVGRAFYSRAVRASRPTSTPSSAA